MRSTIILERKGKYMIELFLVRRSRKIPQKFINNSVSEVVIELSVAGNTIIVLLTGNVNENQLQV